MTAVWGAGAKHRAEVNGHSNKSRDVITLRRRFFRTECWRVGALLFSAFMLVACDKKLDPAESMQRGSAALESGNIATALIELKNAVQAAPDDAKARTLLGQAYRADNNPASALKEYKRARSLGASSDLLNRGITRALIRTGDLRGAAAELALNSDDSNAEWVTLQGKLDLAAGRLDEAKARFDRAIELDPNSLEARRSAIKAAIALGDTEHASDAVSKALKLSEDDFEIWILKGDLDRHNKNYKDSLAAYTRALELNPGSPMALLQRAAVRAGDFDSDGALADLEAIGKASYEDPRALYLRALIAKQQQQPNAALRYLREVLQVLPGHRDSLAQAAILHFEASEFRDSENYLDRLIAIDPGNHQYREMLRSVQLASGKLDTDYGDMEDIDIDTLSDPRLLALLGTAYLKHGKLADGTRSLERASELAPDSAPIRTQLAFTKMRAGDVGQAMDELAEIRKQSPDFLIAGVLQAFGYATSARRDQALEVINELIETYPDAAVLYNVRGYVSGLFSETVKAAADYKKALALDPEFHPASFNLARLAFAEGDKDRAKGIVQSILEHQPNQPHALLTLAALRIEQGDEAGAVALWEQARVANPDAAEPRILLARHYRKRRQLGVAEEIAEEAYALAPFAPAAQLEFAIMKMQRNAPAAALPAILALAERYPEAAKAQQLLAQAYGQLGDVDSLETTLSSMVERFPDSIEPRLGLARLHLGRHEFDRAMDHANALIAMDAKSATGYTIRGDIEHAKGSIGDAISSYQKAHELRPSSEALLRLYSATQIHGNGTQLLDDWLATHANDAPVRLAKAVEEIKAGRKSQAVAQYEKVLKIDPANIIALNNLAWMFFEENNPRAMEIAKRAYDTAPGSAEIADTYGWIMLSKGNVEQAIGLLQKAHERAPANPDIRFHLASAFAKSGDTATALRELETILSDEAEFASRAEATALLGELQE